eukprot:3571823-Pyramimonas_sp.AAC.1
MGTGGRRTNHVSGLLGGAPCGHDPRDGAVPQRPKSAPRGATVAPRRPQRPPGRPKRPPRGPPGGTQERQTSPK